MPIILKSIVVWGLVYYDIRMKEPIVKAGRAGHFISKEGNMLDKAVYIAAKAHLGQQDRYGAPYILHPIRVMMRVGGTLEKIVAALHDIVERSAYTLEDLTKEGFEAEAIAAVAALTKGPGEDYMSYIERLKNNRTAVRVKLADLEDNLDILRNTKPLVNEDLDRYNVFLRARKELQDLL
jgi:(p)ppGpp synthase/HD superfamily hydrolase